MPPTQVIYTEKYRKTQDGEVTENYDKTFTGFFGSCRTLFGIQIPVSEKLKLGSEAVFSFVNYMKLESDDLKDHSFRFPNMKWNFIVRYEILQTIKKLSGFNVESGPVRASKMIDSLAKKVFRTQYVRSFHRQ